MKLKNLYRNIVLGFTVFSLTIWTSVSVAKREVNNRFVYAAASCLPKTVMISVITKVRILTIADLIADLAGQPLPPPTYANMQILGSGVFISPNGHILTCAHLFNTGVIKSISIKDFNGYEFPTDLIYKDVKKDLALCKIYQTSLDYATLANSTQVGEEVIAIGNPLSLEFSVTHGIVSFVDREVAVGYKFNQSDTSINPGNSGGPLFNLNGDLVGINSFIMPPVNAAIFTGLGFSVNPKNIKEFLSLFHV